METKPTYKRRFCEDNPTDFYTKISSHSSENQWNKFHQALCKGQRRKSKERSDSSDGEVVSASFRSLRRSKRDCNATSALRGPLSDKLFDHYFRNIWRESPAEKTNQCTFLNCLWFYMYTKEYYRERVLTWIKKENIFSKTYVFVPIVLWSHWSLLIFCHFGESLKSETKTPCILLLDSLHTLGPSRLEPLIRRFVLDIYETENRLESNDMVEKMPLLVPKVTQQRNGTECGIFVLYFTNLFLESAPDNFSISGGYPYFMEENWFTEDELEVFYERLESLSIDSSDSEE